MVPFPVSLGNAKLVIWVISATSELRLYYRAFGVSQQFVTTSFCRNSSMHRDQPIRSNKLRISRSFVLGIGCSLLAPYCTPSIDSWAQEPTSPPTRPAGVPAGAAYETSQEVEISREELVARIRDLDSDSFAEREAAQNHLSRNLVQVLPEIIAIIEDPASNTSTSLLHFLGFIGQDALSVQGKQAYECLQRVSEQRTTQRAIVAQKILEAIRFQMRDQALERLHSVGVVCEDRQLSVLTQLRPVRNALVIDEKFTGNEQDLQLLPWLFDVQFVKIEGPIVSEKMLAEVMKIPKLRSLQIVETKLESQNLKPLRLAPDLDLLEILYSPVDDSCIEILSQVPVLGDLQLFGTDVSATGAERLKSEIETANVFVGRGGFLGITCEPSSLVIQEALSDGPAAKAGILRNDKLKKIDGVPIYNFEDLRKQLAKSAAGEKVIVDYDRPIMSMRNRDPNGLDSELRNPVPQIPNQGRQFGLQFDGYESRQVEVVLGKRPSDVNR